MCSLCYRHGMCELQAQRRGEVSSAFTTLRILPLCPLRICILELLGWKQMMEIFPLYVPAEHLQCSVSPHLFKTEIVLIPSGFHLIYQIFLREQHNALSVALGCKCH